MSYEGYSEWLCENGHRSVFDAYSGEDKGCTHCGGQWRWRHAVDQTNGYVEDDPSTMPAPRREIGFDEIPMTDHRGNKYFAKLLKFEPVEHWHAVT